MRRQQCRIAKPNPTDGLVRLQQPKRSAAICILPRPAAKPHGEIRSKSDVLQLIGIADHVDANDTANTVIQSHGIYGTVA